MADAFERQEWVRSRVSGALLNLLDEGGPKTLQAVSDLLARTLPTRTKLEYKGLFSKKLSRVSVALGDDVLSLELVASGALVATRVHTSRGIALKREEWPIADWIQALITATEERAAQDGDARRALESWLGIGP